ncbi:MAG: phytanoyl-CoA dioxygenase family protein [Chitinophagales bacterium]|nr:phytanoyl-CoA dioxygenase family protein [Chitinophagales bacterium]MDW8417811.1 phytanoyl-CoA dioxygenase family protein [Chitinophagales bacterium]
MRQDYTYRKKVDEGIKEIFRPAIENLFRYHIPFWGNFFTKPPGEPEMPLHADWRYVNEETDISLNIWAPLSDTDQQNSTLGLVPGSHRVVNQIRGINITDTYRKYAREIADRFVQYVPLKAGEAIVYDHRLLHLSSANASASPRIAATLIMVPNHQKVKIFIAKNEGDKTFYEFVIDSIEEMLRFESSSFFETHTPIHTISDFIFQPIRPEDLSLSDIQKPFV